MVVGKLAARRPGLALVLVFQHIAARSAENRQGPNQVNFPWSQGFRERGMARIRRPNSPPAPAMILPAAKAAQINHHGDDQNEQVNPRERHV
jgi:hypothetical protein